MLVVDGCENARIIVGSREEREREKLENVRKLTSDSSPWLCFTAPELHEYERMKAYYESQGKAPPYNTLGVFRTARRRDELSPAFKAWRYRKQDAKQYEKWKALLGTENMPEDVDKFLKSSIMIKSNIRTGR